MRLALAIMLLLAPACAMQPTGRTGTRPGVEFFAAEPDAAAISAKFADGIARRFAAPADLAALKADLAANGFTCADVPPVEARTDYLMAHCSRARPHGLCTDEWAVDLRFAPGSPGLARASGRFWRNCPSPPGR
jgi:hypothetical protein